MAQHDYNIANQSGADFRADLNNALSAIATVNSGATEPSTTFAHQLWVDTANNVLKIRNAANNAWITTGVSITASNTFTGNITGNLTGDVTGNADTATTLATARTINGTSFDGSANISFDTDSVSEGSSNLYFTNERVDDQVNTLLQAGTGIQLTYDDTAGTLTIANTNDADITGVVAGNGLTGGGTAGTVTLNVAVDDSSIEIDSDALQVKASGITNAMLAGSIANSKLANSSITINSNSLSLGGTLTLDTDDLSEGTSNLYYTQTRFDSAFTAKSTSDLSEGTNLYYTDARFDTRLGTKDTGDLSEGTNLYYTDARARASISEDSTQLSYNSTTGVLSFTQGDTDTVSEGSSNLYYTSARANADFDTRLATKSTTNLSEGTNLYYTTARFDSAFTGKDTDDLSEGSSNLYYTDARANSAIDARVTKSFVDALNVQAASVDANSVALGTDTTGNYVQTITGTANKISVSGSGSESADITLSLPDDVQIASDLTVAGNLTVNGTLTSLDTTNLDIEDNLFQLNAGLTGSPVNDSGMLINRGSSDNGIFMWDESADKFTLGLTTADGSATGNITLNSLGTLVANIEGDVTGAVTGTVSSISNHSTSDLSEGTNLYYTDARFDTRLGTKDTDDVSEGSSNLYYTTARFDSAFSGKSTTDLSEGSNLYYTSARANSDFDTRLATKDTSDLVEGSNLYYTDARVQAVSINNVVEDTTPQLGGNLDLNSSNITGTGDINITGTITTDGLTVDGDATISDSTNPTLTITDTTNPTSLVLTAGNLSTTIGTTTDHRLKFDTNDTERLRIENNGDISFFNSAGTTAKFFWDASAESLGIGTTSHATWAGDLLQTGTQSLFGQLDTNEAAYIVNNIAYDGSNWKYITTGTASIYAQDHSDSNAHIWYTVPSGIAGANASLNERMRIDYLGSLLVNSTSAGSSRLKVVGDASRYGILSENLSGYGAFSLKSTTVAQTWAIGAVDNSSNSDLFIYGGSSAGTKVTLDSSGNVGIGRTSIAQPSSGATTLAIQGTSTTKGGAIRLYSSDDSVAAYIYPDSTNGLSINTSTSHPMVFRTAGSEAMRITSDGSVVVNNSGGDAQIYLGGTSGTSRMYLARTGADSLLWNVSNGNLRFGTNNAERMRIDSSGNVGIGAKLYSNSPVSTLGGFQFYRDHTNGDCFVFDTTTAPYAGDLIFGTTNTERMRIDSSGRVLVGATSSAVHSNVDDLQIGNGTGSRGIGIHSANNANGAIFFSDPDSTLAGQIEYSHDRDDFVFVTGTATRLRIDSDGLKFGTDTAAANALDDYEEGTWTPVLNDSGAAITNTAGTTYNWYVKVGRVVHVSAHIIFSAADNSGNAIRITGLPFTTSSSVAVAGSMISRFAGTTGTFAPYITGSALYFYLQTPSTTWRQIAYNDVGAMSMHISISYQTT